ncbi:uncharacterized protein LOC116120704 [Pistacia vera]|uniref:uncharacterized protein LOC116120704 n=1 Tax=Pistacia vera TaxID=55513 RepID=UPI00126342D6|nr:uncharacterized protein LOC116120704 [Pistacia vera]
MASDGGGGAGDGSGAGDETLSSSSPRNRVKFLCSHGGKILPRAVDGSLKYMGGETRVIAVPREINFSKLMKKIGTMYEGDMVLKYQLIPEDFESLVSVRTDEDLRHMLEEYDRQDTEGNPKLRTFLFPSNPVILENQATSMDPHAIEQRYIDAINGLVRTTGHWKLPPINATRSPFGISSACSSPKSTSPESITIDSFPPDLILNMECYQSSGLPMHRVQSSPSLCGFGGGVSGSGFHGVNSNHFHQLPHHFYANHQHQQQQQPPYAHGYQGHRSQFASLTQADFPRPSQMGHGQHPFYTRSNSTNRSLLGIGSYSKYGIDEPVYGIRLPQRAGSLPHSPKGKIKERKRSIDHNMDQIN